MLFHRTRSLLVLLAVFFAAGITRGQDAQQFDGPDKVFQPFGPTDLGTLTDLQFFAPPELHPLDGWIKPNYGPYFSYERIFWSLHQPDHALIGNPAAVDPVSGELLSDSDNSFIHSVFVWGNRYELGYVDCDGYGWETSILKTNTQYNFERDGLTHIGVIDLGSGGVAAQLIVGGSMAFDYINATRMAGVELMKTYRYPQNQENGSFDGSVSASTGFSAPSSGSWPGPTSRMPIRQARPSTLAARFYKRAPTRGRTTSTTSSLRPPANSGSTRPIS